MRSFRHPRWQHLDYRVKVATTQENKPPTQGTHQWTFTTPRWRCGSILLPSLNAGVPEPTGGQGGRRRPIGYVFMKLAGFYDECSWLRIFAMKIKELPKCSEEFFLFEFLLQNTKVHFPPIRIVCPYDVELVMTSKNSWIKVIYWSAATNSKWESEVNVIFLLVYEFRELLLRFDGENRRKWQRCDHRSLFPSLSRITSRLLRRLECLA